MNNFQQPWSLTMRMVLSMLDSAWGATGDARFSNLREMLIMMLEGRVDDAEEYMRSVVQEIEKAREQG